MVGRSFRSDEYTRDHHAGVALITYALWQSSFGGRADVVGQRVTFAGARGHSYDVVGVLPRDFFFPDATNEQPAVLIPGALDPTQTRANVVIWPLVRLRDGVSAAAAIAEMQAIVTNVERDFPAYEQGRRVELIPLRDAVFGRVRAPLLMLLAATMSVLLLASANLAHLVMARLRARSREVGIRLAIGASRWRVARQLIIEALVLFAAGGAAALLIASALSRLVVFYMPPALRTYRIVPATLDWRVVGFAMGLAAGVAVLSALVPAIRALREDVRATLQGATAGGGSRFVRSDAVLIFAQTAVGIALLVTGLLIVRSFATLAGRPLGFSPDRVRTLGLEFPEAMASDPAGVLLTQRHVYEALKARMPVALVDGIPGMHLRYRRLTPRSRSAAAAGQCLAGKRDVLRGLRTPSKARTTLHGRGSVLERRRGGDRSAGADLLWPGVDPLGRSVREVGGTMRTVVGVVQTVRTDLAGRDFQKGGAFVPFAKPRFYIITYRAERGAPQSSELAALVAAVAPGMRVTTQPLQVFERQLGQPRFLALLLGALGVLAVVLTLVGVLGVVNHEVVRRTKEIGIRAALGADPQRIRRIVLSGALVPAFLGGMLGLSASLWLTEALRALLYGLSPHDPAVYAITLAVMLLTVLVGSVGPAWRAARVDAMIALRAE